MLTNWLSIMSAVCVGVVIGFVISFRSIEGIWPWRQR